MEGICELASKRQHSTRGKSEHLLHYACVRPALLFAVGTWALMERLEKTAS